MSKEKELYKVCDTYDAFFTGRTVKVTTDGSKLLCQCGPGVKILDISTRKVENILGSALTSSKLDDDDPTDAVLTFELSFNNDFVVSSHKSGLLRLWNFHDCSLVKQWKCIHKGGVTKLALTSDSLILASGGTDSSLRLWDVNHNSCTHNLLGAQGVFSVVKFYEYGKNILVFGAADDSTIRAWDVSTGRIAATLTGHFSQVTALDFHYKNGYTISIGRDKVMILWRTLSGENIRTIPLFESAEGLVVLPVLTCLPKQESKLPPDGLYVATAGQMGKVRLWDVTSGRELFKQSNSLIDESQDGLAITNLVYNEATSSLFVTSFDHNIFIINLDTFAIINQFVGWPDEIVSIAVVGKGQSHVAVATNNVRIALYSRNDMSCQLLSGHTDFVLALASSPVEPDLFVSAAKDHSVRLWLLEEDMAVCVASATRHTSEVLSVSMMMTSHEQFVSASADCTMKLWNIPAKLKKISVPESLVVKQTVKAHDKDINSIAVSPNDKIIATGSQDKTAKLWLVSDLSCIGTLSGHRRGVWSVRFSPVDQVILTASADMTIRLWSLSDLSCLKTLEGHDASVLCADFLSHGLQIISGAGDGLIKLWSIKTSECIITLDAHSDKVWCIATADRERKIYSGSSDSKLIQWEDWTEKAREERILAEQQKTLDNQQLSNLIHSGQLQEAIALAIGLNRPHTVYKILFDCINQSVEKPEESSKLLATKEKLEETILALSEENKLSLLNFAAHWNTNSKYCPISQMVISMLLAEVSTGKLKPDQKVLEAILPYTERHFTRLTQLFQDLHFIQYAKLRINPVSAVPKSELCSDS